MDELISRRDTISAMEGTDWYHIDSDGQLTHGANSKEDEPLYKAEDVYTVLNTMPSAQPETHEERTETHACDCISRKAAMELVKDVCDAIMSGCESWYDPETEDEVYKDIREVDAILKCNKEVRIALRNMPSAQPEPSYEAIKEYCRKRCLSIVDTALLEKYLPSAQPEQRWIPVTERLPDTDNEVLVTVLDMEDDYVEVYKGFYQDHEWWTQWCHGCLRIKDEPCGANIVTAWMPLPEPYAERRTDG